MMSCSGLTEGAGEASEALLLPLGKRYCCFLGGASRSSGGVKVFVEFGGKWGLATGAPWASIRAEGLGRGRG